MIAAHPHSPVRIGFVLAVWLVSLSLPLLSVPSTALAKEAAGQPAARLAQPAQPVPPQPEPERGTYVSLIWLALVIVSVSAWLYVTGWVCEDAIGIGLDSRLWTSIMLGAGICGALLAFLVHAVFSFLLLVGVGAAFAAYVQRRNEAVPEQFKLFTKKAATEAVPPGAVAVGGQESEAQQARLRITLSNEAQQSLDDFVAARPDLSEAAAVLGDLIGRASLARARVVRVEPAGAEDVVRFDLDGLLRNIETLPAELGQPVLTCAVRFAAGKGEGSSGGRLTALLPGGESVEVTAKAVKGRRGPTLVISLPDWTKNLYKGGFAALGMHSSMAEKVKRATANPRSVVVISGPSGAGKTSTLHATISEVDIYTTDVVTLEGSIEHELEQVVRHEVDMASDEAYQKALADVVREEPHVIAVDELTTAQQGAPLFEYAAEGGRVLITMQADDSGQAVQRLLLGVDAALLGSTLVCVLNQRLLRKLCEHCKQAITPKASILAKLKIDPSQQGTWFQPVGCERCFGTGYHGRTALFELLLVNDRVREVIRRGSASADAVRNAAGSEGLRTLLHDGILKVRQGITTVDEVRRVLG